MSLIEKVNMGLTQQSANHAGWVTTKLNEHGPWNNKTNDREKLNSVLRFHLANSYENTIDVRGYLTSVDNEEIWLDSLNNKVLPLVAKLCH